MAEEEEQPAEEPERVPADDDEPWAKTSSGDADSVTTDDDS